MVDSASHRLGEWPLSSVGGPGSQWEGLCSAQFWEPWWWELSIGRSWQSNSGPQSFGVGITFIPWRVPKSSGKTWSWFHFSELFSLVTQSCPTLCDPMNYSMPSFPVLTISWNLLRLIPLSQWGYLTISSSVASFSSCPQSFPASGSFPISQLFTSHGQTIRMSASASVLPMNIQDWFPLGVTGLISLQSKGLSRVFSNTTV